MFYVDKHGHSSKAVDVLLLFEYCLFILQNVKFYQCCREDWLID